jgi:predicted nicotinamide N-methyase
MALDLRSFILEHTRLQTPPLVPEIRLYLADKAMRLWGTVMEEVQDLETPAPLWGFAWAGGQAVARYLLDHSDLVDGKTVLDFGSGSGICAVAAMKAGAASVLAADIDPFSGEAVTLNAEANGVRVDVTRHNLLDREPPSVDVILAGDIAYEQPMAERAMCWLREANDRGVRVLVGDPGRAYFSEEGFVRVAEYDVPTSLDLEGKERMHPGVYTFPVSSPSG